MKYGSNIVGKMLGIVLLLVVLTLVIEQSASQLPSQKMDVQNRMSYPWWSEELQSASYEKLASHDYVYGFEIKKPTTDAQIKKEKQKRKKKKNNRKNKKKLLLEGGNRKVKKGLVVNYIDDTHDPKAISEYYYGVAGNRNTVRSNDIDFFDHDYEIDKLNYYDGQYGFS